MPRRKKRSNLLLYLPADSADTPAREFLIIQKYNSKRYTDPISHFICTLLYLKSQYGDCLKRQHMKQAAVGCAVVACVFLHWGRDEEEWGAFHPSSKHKLLTTDSGGKKAIEKHLHSSILLNLNKSPCANARCVFRPTITTQHTFRSFEKINKPAASSSLLLSMIYLPSLTQ